MDNSSALQDEFMKTWLVRLARIEIAPSGDILTIDLSWVGDLIYLCDLTVEALASIVSFVIRSKDFMTEVVIKNFSLEGERLKTICINWEESTVTLVCPHGLDAEVFTRFKKALVDRSVIECEVTIVT